MQVKLCFGTSLDAGQVPPKLQTKGSLWRNTSTTVGRHGAKTDASKKHRRFFHEMPKASHICTNLNKAIILHFLPQWQAKHRRRSWLLDNYLKTCSRPWMGAWNGRGNGIIGTPCVGGGGAHGGGGIHGGGNFGGLSGSGGLHILLSTSEHVGECPS